MGLRDRLDGLLGSDAETGESDRTSSGERHRARERSRTSESEPPPAPTGGQSESASASSAGSSSAAAEQRRLADDLAGAWPGYDLEFSPASLERLDDLIADEFDGSPPGVDRESLRAESPPGVVPEGASFALGSGSATAELAAYFGEVFVRAHGGEWRSSGDRPQIEVRGGAGTAQLDPLPLVSAAVQGYVSLARVHDAVADDAGMDATAD